MTKQTTKNKTKTIRLNQIWVNYPHMDKWNTCTARHHRKQQFDTFELHWLINIGLELPKSTNKRIFWTPASRKNFSSLKHLRSWTSVIFWAWSMVHYILSVTVIFIFINHSKISILTSRGLFHKTKIKPGFCRYPELSRDSVSRKQ